MPVAAGEFVSTLRPALAVAAVGLGLLTACGGSPQHPPTADTTRPAATTRLPTLAPTTTTTSRAAIAPTPTPIVPALPTTAPRAVQPSAPPAPTVPALPTTTARAVQPPAPPAPALPAIPPPTAETPGSYYSSCKEAKAAGAAPLHRGESGYRPGLDRDNDGVACE
ncbi:excalibur calcium-binding domain-containing protein [Nocardia sp. N2S4-5]|uniref:excalibur calcium-binding domain-containing protein n=1 Tax=Nocardia sp. N2S4-5 TaxID=3351565 RepID=UPI0037CE9EE9